MPHLRSTHRKLPAERPREPQVDFEVNWGLIPTITILSHACREWLDENADTEPWQWFRDDLVAIEPGYAPLLVDAMTEAGLIEAEASP